MKNDVWNSYNLNDASLTSKEWKRMWKSLWWFWFKGKNCDEKCYFSGEERNHIPYFINKTIVLRERISRWEQLSHIAQYAVENNIMKKKKRKQKRKTLNLLNCLIYYENFKNLQNVFRKNVYCYCFSEISNAVAHVLSWNHKNGKTERQTFY